MSETKFKLFRRSNGIYYLIVEEDHKRRYRSTGCTRKRGALKALTQYKKLFSAKAPSELLSSFNQKFKAYAEVNFSKRTSEIYDFDLSKFLSVVGDMPLSKVTPQHCDVYKITRLKTINPQTKEPLKPVTVNIELRTLRAAFNTAIRWELIESNPFHGQKFVPVPQKAPTYFTKAEFQTLIATIKENWLREIVVFATLTGMRRGEIVNLRWQDVDLQRRIINVQSSLTFKTKQGRRRTIPLSETAFYLLSAKHSKSADELVFTLNGKKIFDEWLTHAFKNAVYEAKLRKDELHFHSLRHTFASWLVQDGVSLFEVQKLLGHSSSRVTEIYSHLQPEQMHSTVNRIDLQLN